MAATKVRIVVTGLTLKSMDRSMEKWGLRGRSRPSGATPEIICYSMAEGLAMLAAPDARYRVTIETIDEEASE